MYNNYLYRLPPSVRGANGRGLVSALHRVANGSVWRTVEESCVFSFFFFFFSWFLSFVLLHRDTPPNDNIILLYYNFTDVGSFYNTCDHHWHSLLLLSLIIVVIARHHGNEPLVMVWLCWSDTEVYSSPAMSPFRNKFDLLFFTDRDKTYFFYFVVRRCTEWLFYHESSIRYYSQQSSVFIIFTKYHYSFRIPCCL